MTYEYYLFQPNQCDGCTCCTQEGCSEDPEESLCPVNLLGESLCPCTEPYE